MKILRVEYIDVPQEIIDAGRKAFTTEEIDSLEKFEDDGHEVELESGSILEPILSVFTEECLDYIMALIDKYGVICKVIDLTDEYTKSDSVFEEFLSKYPDKRKNIEDLILYDMTVDDVLDKINKFGIDSLTKIDKEILNNS
jgi:hypothetical protein